MKIVCGALAALLFCVAGAIWYVYQKKAVFLPALFGLCGFPKIKESCYYDGSGHFRPATKEDKVGFFMQHPIFGGFYHMFFNLEDNALKAIAPAKYKDFMQAQGRAEQTDTSLDAFNYLTGLVEKGQAKLVSGLYPQEAMKDHPYRSHLTGMFYYGQPGKPRPKAIFPMYGLDWNIKALPEDQGLAVFSIAGRQDEFGFANVEAQLPALEKTLGRENVSVKIIDGLGHGFGIGSETKVKNWLQEAVVFWEAHR